MILHFNFILYSLLNQTPVSLIMSLIMHIFHLLVNSFRISCFTFDTSYLSIHLIQVSCAFSLNCFMNSEGMLLMLSIIKSHCLLFPSYIFRKSSSSSYFSFLGNFHYLVRYFRVPLCLATSLVVSFCFSILS